MKKFFLVGLLLSLSLSIFSQKTIVSPFIEASNANGYTINKITLSKAATTLNCTYKAKPSQWFSIPNGTYIQANDSEEKLHVTAITEPYTLNKRLYTNENGECSFTLTFPPISKKAKTIDYIEGNKGGTWEMYGIALSDEQILDYLPNAYYGSWLLADGSNKWHISFLRDMIIYQGNWFENYTCTPKDDGYTLILDDQTLYIEILDGKLHTGENKNNMLACTKKKEYDTTYAPPIEKLPEMTFGMDTAVFSGCIANYSPKLGKTGTIYLNNIYTGKQTPQIIEINANGSFYVKVALYHPQSVYIRLPNASFSPILIPGKETKLYYNNGDINYLGENAELNTAMHYLNRIRSYNYTKVREKMDTISQADYMAYCDECYVKDKKKLAKQVKKLKFSPEIKDLTEKFLHMQYVEYVLNYERQKSSVAYKYKKKGEVYDYEKLDPKYYSLLNEIAWDDLHLLLGSSYKSFINRIMYSDLIRLTRSGITEDNILNHIKNLGVTFTEEEQKTIDGFNAFNKLDWVKENKALIQENMEDIQELRSKDPEAFKSTSQSRTRWTDIKTTLEGNDTINITQEESSLLEELSKYENKKHLKIQDKYYNSDTLRAMSKKYSKYSIEVYYNKRREYRKHILDSLLTIDHQFMADIMSSQELCPSADKPLPLTELKKSIIEQQIKTPEIKDYIMLSNEWVIAKLEANKTATGFNVNKVPETEGEKLFDEMIKPFHGKVIYVDFWATWCGPCRGGMTKIKPLKEELKDNKDIVFLYITSVSSPEDTWKAMIPDIKGEHYRLSRDEWNYITTQFGVSGIPHYMLVNKKGEVVINDRSIDPGHNLKETLLKYTAE